MSAISKYKEESIQEACKRISSNYGCLVLGIDYILNLGRNNKLLWWNFVSSFTDNPNINIDFDGSLFIEYHPFRDDDITFKASLKKEEIALLSDSNAKSFIEQRKNSGKNTAIFVGNGVSIPFGSCQWEVLSDNLFDFLSPYYVDDLDKVATAIGDTTYAKTSIVNMNISPAKYINSLWSSIYDKYETKMHVPNTLIRSIVKIKNKYSNTLLYTYNYDEFLELDYEEAFHRTLAHCIDEKSHLSTYEPMVTHLHGIVSYKSKMKRHTVLTSEEYYENYKTSKWVYRTQYDALYNNLSLFVGSSLSDLFQMSVINDVRTNKYKKYSPLEGLWFCYALLCFKDMSTKDIAIVYNYYYRKGVKIIFTDDYVKLPALLDSLF